MKKNILLHFGWIVLALTSLDRNVSAKEIDGICEFAYEHQVTVWGSAPQYTCYAVLKHDGCDGKRGFQCPPPPQALPFQCAYPPERRKTRCLSPQAYWED